jgi:hypothetical protein
VTPGASSALGAAWAIVAGLGAWLEFTPLAPFTLRSLDLLWIVMVISAVWVVAQRRAIPRRSVQDPLFVVSYWPFMVAMMVLPVLGVILHPETPATAVSASLRFFVVASFPVLAAWLRVDVPSFWRGFVGAMAVAVMANLSYAILQAVEFAGVLPPRSLPHHQLASYLPQARFSDAGRAPGLFLSGNHLGYFGLMAALVFGARFVRRPRLVDLMLTLAALALPALGNSRSALFLSVGALAILPLYVLALRQRAHASLASRLAVASVALVLIAVTVSTVAPLRQALKVGRIEQALAVAYRGLEADNSIQTRILEFWPRALAAFQANPWGTGAEPSTLIGTIDSAWLTYLVQGSLPLILLYALFLGGAVLIGMRGALAGRLPELQSAGTALTWAAITLGMGSLVLSPLHVPSVLLVFLALWIAAAGSAGRTPSA